MSKARELANLGNAYSDGGISGSNLVINGAMQVWQRGTSSSSAGYSTVDRYEMSGTSTRSRSTDAPEGFQYSLQQALTAGNANQVEQFIEAANAVQLKGKTATLSFYAKATGSVEMYLYASTFSSVDDKSSKSFFVSNQTIGNATLSWVRYTVEIDFSAQANVVNGCGILIGFRETGSSTATAYITGVMLEIGDTATPFEHPRSYGDELLRCQRYYYSEYISTQNGNIVLVQDRTSSVYYGTLFFPVEMRTGPTVTSTGVDRLHKPAVRFDTIASGPNFAQANVNSVYIYAGATNADTASTVAILGASSGGTIQADAEL